MIPCFLSFHFPLSLCYTSRVAGKINYMLKRKRERWVWEKFYLNSFLSPFPSLFVDEGWVVERIMEQKFVLKIKALFYHPDSQIIFFSHRIATFVCLQIKKLLWFNSRYSGLEIKYTSHSLLCWSIGNQFQFCNFIHSHERKAKW